MVDVGQAPSVAIVLVNWNSYGDTLECVDSIKQSAYQNYTIVVVDNGSVDESVARLKARDLEYVLLLSETNLGFTGGNNIGIKHAMSLGVDFVFLLNNDTLIENSCVGKMVEAAQHHPRVGVVTPKIFFHPDRHLIWSAGTSYDQERLMGINEGYKSLDGEAFNQPKFLDYAVGCALLIRREVIETIGMLTEDYFATWEDVDFGLRVNRGGYKVLYEPSAIVWHKESGSAGGTDNPQYVYYQTRSAFVFRSRWAHSLPNAIKGHAYYFAYCLVRMRRFLMHGNFRGIAAVFIAITDAIGGRLGRRDYQILKKKNRKKD